MFKIFLISNTSFGYKNNSPEWLEIMNNYFQQSFIPFLKKHAKEGDYLLHLGNLFYQNNISIDALNIVHNIFSEISSILPVKLMVGMKDKIDDNSINSYKIFKGINNIEVISDIKTENNITYIPHIKNFYKQIRSINEEYLFINHDLTESWNNHQIFNGYHNDYISNDKYVSVGAPYQLKKEDSGKKRGFVVVKFDGKFQKTLVENTISPKFETIKIEKVEDIDTLDPKYLSKNFIRLEIPKDVMEKNRTKIDVVLSQYTIQEVDLINPDEKDSPFEPLEDSDIKLMIQNVLKREENSEELMEEFEKIINLSKIN
jgi:hypothetical protein